MSDTTPEQRAAELLNKIGSAYSKVEHEPYHDAKDELTALIRENDQLLKAEAELKMRLTACEEDKAMLDWLEHENSLHKNTSFLYVVDGYELEIENDRIGNTETFQGTSLRHAIREAMKEGTTNE